MSEPSEKPDSLITGLTTVVQSRKGRTALAAAWPWLLAAATFAGGLVVRSLQIEPRLSAMELQLKDIAKDTSATRVDVIDLKTTEQQKIIRIGKQAAYATAGFESYESSKVRAQKRAWAANYADTFERMVTGSEHVSIDAAYAVMAQKIAPPQ